MCKTNLNESSIYGTRNQCFLDKKIPRQINKNNICKTNLNESNIYGTSKQCFGDK